MLVGILSDTHIPYRSPNIPASVLDALRGVDVILHAGDVDEPWALDVLRDIAPVYAVRGNFHVFDASSGGVSLPESVELDIAGFRIAMTHGHKIGPATLCWKAYMLLQNLRGRWALPAYDRAIARALLRRFPCADVIVFGHTHCFHQAQWGQTLLLNPGAALRTAYFNAPQSPSLVHLFLTPGSHPKAVRIRIEDTAK